MIDPRRKLRHPMPTHYPEKECAAWHKRELNRFPPWSQPTGLEKYAAFVGGWGFQVFGNFGWVLIDDNLNYYPLTADD